MLSTYKVSCILTENFGTVLGDLKTSVNNIKGTVVPRNGF